MLNAVRRRLGLLVCLLPACLAIDITGRVEPSDSLPGGLASPSCLVGCPLTIIDQACFLWRQTHPSF